MLDDPGTVEKTVSMRPCSRERSALRNRSPDVIPDDSAAARGARRQLEPSGTVVTTTVNPSRHGGRGHRAATRDAGTTVPQTEQVMLTKNVKQLAQKLLDTNMTNTELTWQQDGQQYSARVMRQPAADSTGLEQVIAEIMTNKDGKRMKTRLSLKRLAFSHFTQLVNHWDPNIQLHDDVIEGRFHSNTEIGLAFSGGIEPRFFGKVTTAAATMTRRKFHLAPRRTRKSSRAASRPTPNASTLPRDMPDVVNGGELADRHVFDEDTRIIFNSDGSLRVAAGERRRSAEARRAVRPTRAT